MGAGTGANVIVGAGAGAATGTGTGTGTETMVGQHVMGAMFTHHIVETQLDAGQVRAALHVQAQICVRLNICLVCFGTASTQTITWDEHWHELLCHCATIHTTAHSWAIIKPARKRLDARQGQHASSAHRQ